MCIKVCGPIAITRTSEDVEEGEKITYEFDLTSCTFCGMCQDFCTTKAIEMTTDYHMVAEDPKDLVVRGERIKKKVAGKLTCSDSCVYCTLCAKQCPEGAITVDRANKTWEIDREKCTLCGICVDACPKKSLSIGDINAGPCPEAADVPPPTKIEPKAEEAAPSEEKANNGKLTCSDSCVYCTLCAKKCPFEAITVDREAKTWAVDEEKCIKCGVCVEKCPKKSLSFEE